MSCELVEITNRLHNVELMNMFRNFSVSETFTDVQLIAKGGKKVYAHKLVLVAVSGLLKQILEERPDHPGMTTIHLPDVSYITLRLVINFLYMGSMRLSSNQKADFNDVLKMLEVDIQPLENELGLTPRQPSQTTPKAVNNGAQSSGASAAQSAGPVIVNSFSQNTMALLMGNGGGQMQLSAATNSPNRNMTAGSTSQELVPTLTANCQASCLNQGSCLNQASCLASTQASCFNQTSCVNTQLVQVLPIAFATNDLQQFAATSAANLMPTAGGGGLVAFANIGNACSATQINPNGPVQLFATNGGNAATSGLRLVTTSTPLQTTAPTVAAAAPLRVAGDMIDLSKDDDESGGGGGQPPPTTSSTIAAPDLSSPNSSGRRKRTASPESAATLAKRVLDASRQTTSKDIIDLDKD